MNDDEWLIPLLMIPIALATIALLFGMCWSATQFHKAGTVYGGANAFMDGRVK